MYVRCDESSLYSWTPCPIALTGNFWSVRSIKTMHTGFSAYIVLHYANAFGADMEETGRYDLAWKDFV